MNYTSSGGRSPEPPPKCPIRKYLLAGLAIVLFLGGILFTLLRPWHCPVNRAAFDWIEEGMTKAEVEEIIRHVVQ